MDVVSTGAATSPETVSVALLLAQLFVTQLQVPRKLSLVGFVQVHIDGKCCRSVSV